jgi:hypothetical protein
MNLTTDPAPTHATATQNRQALVDDFPFGPFFASRRVPSSETSFSLKTDLIFFRILAGVIENIGRKIPGQDF